MIRFAAGWLALAWAAGVSAAPTRIAVVADASAAGTGALLAGLRAAGGEGLKISLHRLPEGELTDPILKGRIMAAVQEADLIVTIADRATEFILAEREQVPVFFVGAASLLDGRALAAPDVSGILSYNVERSLDLAKALGLSPLGLAYTPGYAPVAALVEAGARARGLEVVSRRIAARRGVGPAIRDLTRLAKAVWVLGDPLLTKGPGFAFLVEQSLAARVPVLAPGRREVEGGALLAFEPAAAALAGEAVRGLEAVLAGGAALPDAPGFAPADGIFLFNRALADRWGVRAPAGERWRGVP